MRIIVFFTYLVMFLAIGGAQRARTEIPRAWGDREVATFQMPLAQRERSPRFMTSDEYYKLTVRPVYRSYPVYLPGREPVGYMETLKQKDPEIVFDPVKLQTDDEWIRAGELVFDAAPTVQVPPPAALQVAQAQNQMALQWASSLTPPNRDGIIPYVRWVVIQKGVVQPAVGSCASCHTRVMPDGTIVKGAQGDFAVNRFLAKQAAFLLGQPGFGPAAFRALRETEWILSSAPWVSSRAEADNVPDAEWIRRQAAMPPGVIERHGTSATHPPHVPSLIGIKDVKYLDATGLVRHRSLGDLMRYVAANYGVDLVAHFGDFQPSTSFAAIGAQDGTRYSDEQLYALAMYLYSLKPPPNPNRFDDSARRGQAIFQRQGCASCHTPPLYTNNKLTPATGFKSTRRPSDDRRAHECLGGQRSNAGYSDAPWDGFLQSAFAPRRVVSKRIRPHRPGGHTSRNGSTQRVCAPTTSPRVSIWAQVRSKVTPSVSACPPRTVSR